MKTISVKAILGRTLLASIALCSCNQKASNNSKPAASNQMKLEGIKVPQVVLDSFKNEFPVLKYENWQGYPTVDYQNYWYEYNPNFYTNEYPGNYVVEFENDSIPYRIMYSKTGTKIAIHKSLSAGLPKAISEAIYKTEYKTWTLEKEKDEIFKDKDSDQLKI